MPEGLSGWRTLRHRLVLHHWAVRGREVVEILPSHRTSASNACASVSWQRWARCSRSGWPAVSPPWGLSIRRPPKVCQRRAEFISNWLCPITAGQSRHSFAQFDLKCSFPYPFLSPGAWGPPQTRRQKAEKFGFFAFLVDFFAFRTALEK